MRKVNKTVHKVSNLQYLYMYIYVRVCVCVYIYKRLGNK